MAATATPTILDPKQLFRVSDVTTSDVTQYTAPDEAGVKITAGGIVNKSASAVTLDFWRETSAGAIAFICKGMTIPGGGAPPVSFETLGLIGAVLLPLEELHTDAGTASALDMWCDGIEMED